MEDLRCLEFWIVPFPSSESELVHVFVCRQKNDGNEILSSYMYKPKEFFNANPRSSVKHTMITQPIAVYSF